MGKVGKISAIKKDYSGTGMQTMDSNLSKIGRTRVPGTGVIVYPFKEIDNKYRTGLDPNAVYIKRILDPTERELEVKRVTELRDKLQAIYGEIDLSPHSRFWNYALASSTNDEMHVKPAKLMDGDNLFDLSNPHQELMFAWLRVHPTIASSYRAWENGDYPAETQFYVADDDIENAVIYRKKLLINNAITKFGNMTPEKKKKVARLLGLPVTDNTKDDVVYVQVDNLLKQTEFKSGKYQGMSTVEIFNRFADMTEDLLHVKDLVKQAVSYSIYRMKPNGRVYKGDLELAASEEELVKHLIDENHQDELLILEGELKMKKMASA